MFSVVGGGGGGIIVVEVVRSVGDWCCVFTIKIQTRV